MYLWSWRKVLLSQSNNVTFFTFNCCAVLSHLVLSNSLQPHALLPVRLLWPWNSPGKNTGVVCHALLWGIFPTLVSKPGLSYCKWILYCLSHQGSPRILEWVAYPFSRGSSCPRNQTGVSCIAGGFLTIWATREVPLYSISAYIILYSIYSIHLFLFFFDNISSKRERRVLFFFLTYVLNS